MGISDLLWALIGLILTIGGTFLEASLATPVWGGSSYTLQPFALGVTYQLGAVLLVSCLGGKNAALLSQIAYLFMGLTWFPVFAQGGGIGYVREPSFGYLLGFIPAAWICGSLAFRALPRVESLAFSCLCGLGSIHLTGIVYLLLGTWLGWIQQSALTLQDALLRFSLHPIPGHLAMICAVTVIAFTLRHLMFY